jgi:hypothetical protein
MPIIINLTVVNADWKEVWNNEVKRSWSITYFTSVLLLVIQRNFSKYDYATNFVCKN